MSLSFSPHLFRERKFSLAPMIDFLFLMLAFFATLAVSRVKTAETEIDLVEIEPQREEEEHSFSDEETVLIYLSIMKNGEYKWSTQIRDYPMQSPQEIAKELKRQHERGLLPKEKEKTQVLLKIDRESSWQTILPLLLAIEEEGFQPRPIYEVKTEGF